jgi:hypothetical protein
MIFLVIHMILDLLLKKPYVTWNLKYQKHCILYQQFLFQIFIDIDITVLCSF